MPREYRTPLLLLLGWMTLNVVTAYLAPLDPDETYYWMYAQHLDWGYYDHPPAVALLISLGKEWLPGGLGLRLGHVLVSGATLLIIWCLLDRPTGKLFWLAAALLLAQPMLNVYGFIATPDGPLLFFTALYLLAYRGFLRTPSVPRGALWGLTMVGLLYAKYHGVLLIAFTVLPNLRWLLRRPGAWVAALGGIALYLPHLYWQYVNDFPSPRYHLSGRNKPYRLDFTTNFVLNQLLIFSPFLVVYYWRTLRGYTFPGSFTPQARFVRASRWLVLGTLVFFLYMTKNGHPEAQWTAMLCVPLIYLIYHAARDQFPAWRPRLIRLSVATIAVLAIARLIMVAPANWLPFPKPLHHQPWTEALATQAAGRPVIFENSYRLPSLYRFYTGRPAWAITDVDYRLNQYDLWADDSLYHDRPVLMAGQNTWTQHRVDTFQTVKTELFLKPIDSFQVAKGIRLTWLGEVPNTVPAGGEFSGRLQLLLDPNLGVPAVNFFAGLPLSLLLTVYVDDLGYRYYPVRLELPRTLSAGQPVERPFRVDLPAVLPAGPARLEFGLQYQGMPPLKGQSSLYHVALTQVQ